MHQHIAVFTLVSKIICACFGFALLYYPFVIGLRKLEPLSQPIRSRTKTDHDLFTQIFPCSRQLHLFTSSFDWVTGLSVFFVTGHFDCFDVGFTTVD